MKLGIVGGVSITMSPETMEKWFEAYYMTARGLARDMIEVPYKGHVHVLALVNVEEYLLMFKCLDCKRHINLAKKTIQYHLEKDLV